MGSANPKNETITKKVGSFNWLYQASCFSKAIIRQTLVTNRANLTKFTCENTRDIYAYTVDHVVTLLNTIGGEI